MTRLRSELVKHDFYRLVHNILQKKYSSLISYKSGSACSRQGFVVIWSSVGLEKETLVDWGLWFTQRRSEISLDINRSPISPNIIAHPKRQFLSLTCFSFFYIFREMSIATEDNPQDYCIVQPQSPEDIKARSRDLKS